MKVQKHLLLCASPTKQKCFKGKVGTKTWASLKEAIKHLNTNSKTDLGIILRTKVDCLQICKNGPILLIWPDGIWYEKVTSERVIKIIESHVIKGVPIDKWIFKRTPFLENLIDN